MKLDLHSGSLSGDLSALGADLVAFALTEAEWAADSRTATLAAVDSALGGWIEQTAVEEKFSAADDSSVVIQTHGQVGTKRVVLLGLGKSAPGAVQLREIAGRAAKIADAHRATSLALIVTPADGTDSAQAARFAFEGAPLALYRFEKYRKEDDRKPSTVKQFTLALQGGREVTANALARAKKRATAVVRGVALARDLVNEGPNAMYPEALALEAQRVADAQGLEVRVYDEAAIRDMNMELLLAVSAGSDKEPRLVHITYRPKGATEKTPVVAIVGKGITFDSGGYNLKPGGAIDDMKIDMAGAAAVIGTMAAIQDFAPNVVVHAIVPSAENLVNGNAYKLADVYRGHNGKTVEIRNTDAEGRLILIDAIGYALRQNVEEVTTLATLTGACVVALGPYTAGIFSSQQDFLDAIVGAARTSGEDVWALPMHKKLKSMLKSDVADLKNVGERWGGAITAALFLEEFADDTRYAHIDLAGPSFVEKSVEAHIPKGGTGFGVLTLLEYLEQKGA